MQFSHTSDHLISCLEFGLCSDKHLPQHPASFSLATDYPEKKWLPQSLRFAEIIIILFWTPLNCTGFTNSPVSKNPYHPLSETGQKPAPHSIGHRPGHNDHASVLDYCNSKTGMKSSPLSPWKRGLIWDQIQFICMATQVTVNTSYCLLWAPI